MAHSRKFEKDDFEPEISGYGRSRQKSDRFKFDEEYHARRDKQAAAESREYEMIRFLFDADPWELSREQQETLDEMLKGD